MKLLLITEDYRNALYQNIMAKYQGTGNEINNLTTQLLNALEATPENIKKLKQAIKEMEDAQAKAQKEAAQTEKKSATPRKSNGTSKKKKGRK